MTKTIKFNLSQKGIEALQAEINNIQKKITSDVIYSFLKESLEWIRGRAIRYLNQSGFSTQIVEEISGSFELSVLKTYGKIKVNHPKAAYVEFGVGIVGDDNAYPKLFAPNLVWEYNVSSPAKKDDGRWTFSAKESEPLDMRESDVEKKISSKGREYYSTYGGEGAMFMYNAIMDYANSGIAKQIYISNLQRLVG